MKQNEAKAVLALPERIKKTLLLRNYRKDSPFFSVIVPCYNCANTIERLLDSIIAQELGNYIEVILSDDCSTEDYMDKVKPYESKLNIRYTSTGTNSGPGIARQRGMEISKGEWIVFCDSDDAFVPNIFINIWILIKNGPSDRVLVSTKFKEILIETGEVLSEMPPNAMSWVHGKFFNRKKLIEKYNIRFHPDLFTHEDLYFNLLVIGIMAREGLLKENNFIEETTYLWSCIPDSITRTKDNEGFGYIQTKQKDYIDAILLSHLELLKRYPETLEDIQISIIESYYLIYCYEQAGIRINIKNNNGEESELLKNNFEYVKKFVRVVKEKFDLSIDDMNFVLISNPKVCMKIMKDSWIGTGPFYPIETIEQFGKRVIEED